MADYIAWQPCNIYPTAKIGKDTVIGMFSEIGDCVKIGKKCKLGNGAFIPKGVMIEDEVFIGPHCVFTNDKHPKATGHWEITPTLVKKGASIGANVTVLCGIIIGENARIGAGSVVTKSISDGETWAGNPARRIYKI